MITDAGSLHTTLCYLTCTMITEARSLHTTLCYLLYRSKFSVQNTLLSNMHHDNRCRLSAHHTLLSNMYHDNRGTLSAHHICYLTCTMITEACTMLTTHYLLIFHETNLTVKHFLEYCYYNSIFKFLIKIVGLGSRRIIA